MKQKEIEYNKMEVLFELNWGAKTAAYEIWEDTIQPTTAVCMLQHQS